ncbi:hypothetical protein [Paenibacillus xanthanilyticus]|uniref:Uncharacterized protein n=1 Tax=Paenibacillus xanthanilyticus TaxID=1783531 RepID=A0ABV8K5S0_9BACL
MGQRANLLIVRNQSYELFYSHWCANTLPTDLFWGEQFAIPFVEMQRKVDESGWLDDVWAEGGAVIDLDLKKLVLYGGEDILCDIPLRNLYLDLLRCTWHGWEVQWAYEGIVDLATYVGYPKGNVLTKSSAERVDIRFAPPEEKSWVNMVASITFSHDDLLLFPLWGDLDEYLSYGPDLIPNIDRTYGYKRMSLEEWTPTFPEAGFHMDLRTKRLAYWHAKDMPNLSHVLQSTWFDWEVIHHFGDYESQLRSTNGLLKFQDVNRRKLLGELKVLLLRESSNPLDAIASIVKKEADAGKSVEVNPYALRNNRYEIPKPIKEEILDKAITSLENME